MKETFNALESNFSPQSLSPGASERSIAAWGEEGSSPLLVCVAGLHGNEPAGVHACRRVLGTLEERNAPFQGEWQAFAGNLGALAAGRRFLREDMNRIWTTQRVCSVRSRSPEQLEHEDREMAELLRAVDPALERPRGEVRFIDMHTTSADGSPFAAVEDTLRNRDFSFLFHVPVILGIEEEIGGAFMEYVTDRGHICLTLEGGQHYADSAVDNHEALLWIGLEGLGMISRNDFPEVSQAEELIRENCRGIPRAYEIRYRHGITQDDRFRMNPGLLNFQTVQAGQVLASDRRGEVRSPKSGRIIMPLYQEQGDDGFFLGQEFRLIWLKVSAIMRRLGLARSAHLLPGVSRHASKEDFLLVDPGIARWFVVEIFHLLGFRRHPDQGNHMVFSRRRFDIG